VTVTRIEVGGPSPYPVLIGSGLFGELPALLAGATRVAVIHPPTLAVVAARVRTDLAAAGFDGLELRPFFSPQRFALPGVLARTLHALERGPLARLLLRYRFSFLCAAFRAGRNS
jgi:3-dehydroquinate synthase